MKISGRYNREQTTLQVTTETKLSHMKSDTEQKIQFSI